MSAGSFIEMRSSDGPLIALVIALIVTISIFLIFRALVLWYWRIDRIVALLESINSKLDGPDEPKNHGEVD
jgi:hypothetical protein